MKLHILFQRIRFDRLMVKLNYTLSLLHSLCVPLLFSHQHLHLLLSGNIPECPDL